MLNSKRTASNAGCKLLCAQEEAVPPQPALTRLATQPKLSTVVLPLGFGGRMLPFAFFFFLALAAECSTVPVRETCCPASRGPYNVLEPFER